jgi:hypothetical protein
VLLAASDAGTRLIVAEAVAEIVALSELAACVSEAPEGAAIDGDGESEPASAVGVLAPVGVPTGVLSPDAAVEALPCSSLPDELTAAGLALMLATRDALAEVLELKPLPGDGVAEALGLMPLPGDGEADVLELMLLPTDREAVGLALRLAELERDAVPEALALWLLPIKVPLADGVTDGVAVDDGEVDGDSEEIGELEVNEQP